MRYLSTREARPSPSTLSFAEVLLAGLAEDGGLYVPDQVPELGEALLLDYACLPYAELAARIVSLFAGDDFKTDELRRLAKAAYDGFRHAAVAPLVQLDERLWLLELFHGPTLAFKDLALQLVGPLIDAVLARRGEHLTIVGATSGDTGPNESHRSSRHPGNRRFLCGGRNDQDSSHRRPRHAAGGAVE